ncbi:Arylsulfatase [Halioglobus japonicus]|nr:Arylsulfatase [Halioglobus japonicus]
MINRGKAFIGNGRHRAWAWLACVLCMSHALASEPPNIVLIVADDIGYSDFGAFGGEIDTPNIDALARAGVRFSNFHAASSCAPTRAMLLTGVDNHRAGVGSMRELMPLSHRGEPGYDGVLNESVQTIASMMQASGYRTWVAGKWHLGIEDSNLPPARGFDGSVIQADSGSDNFEMRPYLPMYPEARWFENGRRMQSLPEDFYSSRYFVDWTIAFLEATRAEGKPFFAYLAFQANHLPLQAPAEFIDAYRGHYTQGWAKVREARIQKIRELDLFETPATFAAGPAQDEWDGLTEQQQYFEARRMQAYAGMATAMDYEIGRLITYLRDSGQYQNTVFVLFSDNGATATEPYDNAYGRRWLESNYHRETETLGEKGSWVAAGSHWGRVSNTPLAGTKFSSGEGGVRVPLIVSGLSSAAQGAVNREFTYITDLAPTLLEIAGIESPQVVPAAQTMTGRSLLPMMTAAAPAPYRSDEALGYEFSGNSALYQGDYKLVRNQPPAGDRQWRLYKIDEDPGETTDLRERMPDLYQNMLAEYDAYASENGVLPMPENYSVAKQVMINTIVFSLLPKYLPYVGLALVLVLAVYFYRRSGRRTHKR